LLLANIQPGPRTSDEHSEYLQAPLDVRRLDHSGLHRRVIRYYRRCLYLIRNFQQDSSIGIDPPLLK
jgi:hypothetical protein